MWGIFISLIMIVGTMGFLSTNTTNSNSLNSFEYNGYTFEYSGNQIITKINDATLKFFITPFDAQSFNVSNEIIKNILNSDKVILSVDPDSQYREIIGLASFYVQTDLLSIGKSSESAAVSENDFGYPIVTCEDATDNTFVIEFIEGNVTEINPKSKNCIQLVSNQPYGHLILRDALAYRLYGIIKE